MVSLVFYYILQLPHTVILNSEKLTHPTVHYSVQCYTRATECRDRIFGHLYNLLESHSSRSDWVIP